MKGFALGLALKQRRKATQKSPIETSGLKKNSIAPTSIRLSVNFHQNYQDVLSTSIQYPEWPTQESIVHCHA